MGSRSPALHPAAPSCLPQGSFESGTPGGGQRRAFSAAGTAIDFEQLVKEQQADITLDSKPTALSSESPWWSGGAGSAEPVAVPSGAEWSQEPVVRADRHPSLAGNPASSTPTGPESPCKLPQPASAAAHDTCTDLGHLMNERISIAAASAHMTERRLNRHFALLHAGDQGVDCGEAATRLGTLLHKASDVALLRALRGANMVGGAPVRLLEALEPGLQAAAARRADSSGLLPGPLAHYDGLHLTLAGIAGALIAWSNDAEVVRVPAGYVVVSAPRDGGLYGTPAAGTAVYQDAVQENIAPLDFLISRWPALVSLLDGACGATLRACRAFLKSLSAGATPPPPPHLVALHHRHISSEETPCNSFVMAVETTPGKELPGPAMAAAVYNAALTRLFGMTFDSAHAETGLSSVQHPAALVPRCLALISAANKGWSAFQTEMAFVRRLPTTRCPSKAHATPPKLAGPLGTPASAAVGAGAGSDSDGAGGLPAQDSHAVCPFYAVTTSHFERYAGSSVVMARTTYISDILCTGRVVAAQSMDYAAAQLDAVSQLLLARDHSPPQVLASMSKTPGASPASVMLDVLRRYPDSELLRVACRMAIMALNGGSAAATADLSSTSARLADIARQVADSVPPDVLQGITAAVYCSLTGADGRHCSVPVTVCGAKKFLTVPKPADAALLGALRSAAPVSSDAAAAADFDLVPYF